jgi:hypothetical protein
VLSTRPELRQQAYRSTSAFLALMSVWKKPEIFFLGSDEVDIVVILDQRVKRNEITAQRGTGRPWDILKRDNPNPPRIDVRFSPLA